MAGQSRKWAILVATVWVQAWTGTNFDFSAYSSALKAVLGVSQVELNYLAVASDLGKLFGCTSGLALMHLPLPAVLLIAAVMGVAGYGLQWLVITQILSLPYFLVFLLCLLAGCSICWFNTVCFVLCIRNFPSNQPLAISLTVSFNGVSAALYALAANALDPSSSPLYLLLNATVPLLVSLAALPAILCQPPLDPLPPDAVHRNSVIFLVFNALAVLTGAYLLLFSSSDSSAATSRLLLAGALVLLALPLAVPGVVYSRDWLRSKVGLSDGSGFLLVDIDELARQSGDNIDASLAVPLLGKGRDGPCCDGVAMLGEEHSAGELVRKLDFWLYYVAYFCGGTIGLVFSNNLGQIAQSLGQGSKTTTLLTLYSSFSFFGRLLSAAPDYVRAKLYFARTGWLTIALIPTPIAFFLLASSGGALALHTGTALVGLSSGFIFAAAVSITSELFGPNSVSVNHNILITNIPLGSLLYGLLAALVYDANAVPAGLGGDTVVCMGRRCYLLTFLWWGCVSLLGLASSLLLFFRTKYAYDHFEHKRTTQLN